MNNPFPRATSGSYKSILVEGLKNIGETKVAEEFNNGTMKLAVVASITGNVKLFPELQSVCEKALNAIEVNDTVRYYFWGITNGQFAIASSNVDFIYDGANKADAAYAKMRSEQSGEEIIQPYFAN
jgi:AAA+ ATPase superfamily predicted ATPase